MNMTNFYYAVLTTQPEEKCCLFYALNFQKRFPASELWLCLTLTNIHFYNYYLGCSYVFINPHLRNDKFACIRSLKGYKAQVHVVAGNFYKDRYSKKCICLKVR